MKGELGGNFEDVVLAVMQEPRLYDAKELRSAMKVNDTSGMCGWGGVLQKHMLNDDNSLRGSLFAAY